MAYELNPYQGLSIANLSSGAIPNMQYAAAPTSIDENYDTGLKRMEDAKSRVKKDTLSAKLEAAFGKMYTPSAVAAQGSLADKKKKLAELQAQLDAESAKYDARPEVIEGLKTAIASQQKDTRSLDELMGVQNQQEQPQTKLPIYANATMPDKATEARDAIMGAFKRPSIGLQDNIPALQSQLDAEMAKPIKNPAKIQELQAQLQSQQNDYNETEKASKQLIPQAEVLQALAGLNPEKASAEYLDLIQKQQTSGLAGLKYQDEMAGRDAFASANRGSGAFANIYEGGAQQAKLDHDEATNRINEATRQNKQPSQADLAMRLKADQALTKFRSSLMSSYPSLTQEANTAWGTKALDNKELNKAFTKANTDFIIHGDGKEDKGLLGIARDSIDLSSVIANAKSPEEVKQSLSAYSKLEQDYNSKLAMLDGDAKSAFIDKFKFVPVADVINKIQDEDIRRDANAAQRELANAQFKQSQQKFGMEQNQFDFNRTKNQLENSKLSDPYVYEKIYKDAGNKNIQLPALVKELSQLIEPGLSVNDAEFSNYLNGQPSSKLDEIFTKFGLTAGMKGEELRDQIRVIAEDRHKSAMDIVGNNFKKFNPAIKGRLEGYFGENGFVPTIVAEQAKPKEVIKVNPAKKQGVVEKGYEYTTKNGIEYKRKNGTFNWEKK